MENIKSILNLQFMNTDFWIYVIKLTFLGMCTYYMYLKILNDSKIQWHKFIVTLIADLFVSITCSAIRNNMDLFTSMVMYSLLLSLLYSKIINKNIANSILITVFSLSVNYILFAISIIISFLPNLLINMPNDFVKLLLIILIDLLFMYFIFKIKKFKNGLIFFKKRLTNNYLEILVLNISVCILFFIIILSNFDITYRRNIFWGFIIFSIIMFITIQKSLTMYYKQKLLIQELEDTKKELKDRKEDIAKLEKENLEFSKKSHSIAHKQKVLEYKLRELRVNSEIASELDISASVEKVKEQIQNDVVSPELSKTNIQKIDDMLDYWKLECENNNIEFELQLNGNIYYMINNCLSIEELEILIADHVKDAIIAINNSINENKSILLRLGKIDGYYSMYVYDSGIEFEIDTIRNLGKKPITTHADKGGSGMGFMNTFDVLKKYKGSLIINEYGKPSLENYTKYICVKFDGDNEFKINSYRKKLL